jgi:hypothetical protein
MFSRDRGCQRPPGSRQTCRIQPRARSSRSLSRLRGRVGVGAPLGDSRRVRRRTRRSCGEVGHLWRRRMRASPTPTLPRKRERETSRACLDRSRTPEMLSQATLHGVVFDILDTSRAGHAAGLPDRSRRPADLRSTSGIVALFAKRGRLSGKARAWHAARGWLHGSSWPRTTTRSGLQSSANRLAAPAPRHVRASRRAHAPACLRRRGRLCKPGAGRRSACHPGHSVV